VANFVPDDVDHPRHVRIEFLGDPQWATASNAFFLNCGMAAMSLSAAHGPHGPEEYCPPLAGSS
jgi:hypothetical protein